MNFKKYSLIDAFGRVLLAGISEEIPEHTDCVLTVNDTAPDANHYWCFTDNQWKARPASPDFSYEFNWETKQWEDPRSIQELQKYCLVALEKEKAARKIAHISYGGYLVDAHTTAQTNITNKLNELAAREALAMPVDVAALNWRAADNSMVYFDSSSAMKEWLLGLVVAISQRTSEIYSWSWAEKEKIRTTTTKEELEALGWLK